MTSNQIKALQKIVLNGGAIAVIVGFAVIALIAIILPLFLIWVLPKPPPPYTSLTSTAPDGKQWIEIFEDPTGMDRTFQIILHTSANTNQYRVLFNSPDEGSAGTERFVWSDDSRYLLLIGRNFCVETNARLTDYKSSYKADVYGYFLYDTLEQKALCNAAQSDRFPPFHLADLEGKRFSKSKLDAAIAEAQEQPKRR